MTQNISNNQMTSFHIMNLSTMKFVEFLSAVTEFYTFSRDFYIDTNLALLWWYSILLLVVHMDEVRFMAGFKTLIKFALGEITLSSCLRIPIIHPDGMPRPLELGFENHGFNQQCWSTQPCPADATDWPQAACAELFQLLYLFWTVRCLTSTEQVGKNNYLSRFYFCGLWNVWLFQQMSMLCPKVWLARMCTATYTCPKREIHS